MTTELTTLQTLTDTTVDSAIGYEKAAQKADNPQLKTTLTDQATKRRATVKLLNDEIVRLGGDARNDGTTLGAAHRAFVGLADAFGDSNEAATERVEEGEDYLEGKFSKALEDVQFSAECRAVVERAHREIKEGEQLTNRLAELHD